MVSNSTTNNLLSYQINEHKKYSTCDFGYRVKQTENTRHQMGNPKTYIDGQTMQLPNEKGQNTVQKTND